MAFAVNQSPGTVLSSVFSAAAGTVLLDSAVYVIGVSDIKFLVFQTLKDVDVIHN